MYLEGTSGRGCKLEYSEKTPDSLPANRYHILVSVCVCLLSVCVSLASDSSEAIKVIIVKLGMVTASDMIMHHMLLLIIFTLTCIQGHISYSKKS